MYDMGNTTKKPQIIMAHDEKYIFFLLNTCKNVHIICHLECVVFRLKFDFNQKIKKKSSNNEYL